MLDRLQEDDGVTGGVEVLDEAPLEAKVRPPVAKRRVLVGLTIRVDADHGCGRPREHVRSVSLATGEVHDSETLGALRDPLVDDEVAPEPVVLGGDVRECALYLLT